MSKAYMQMIYIDSEGNARHTNVRAAMTTNAATLKAFGSLRSFAVPEDEQADFLCDYYNASGDLVDSIAIRREDFTRITGEPVRSDVEYRQIDAGYWQRARREHANAT